MKNLSLGKKIKALRLSKGFTQEALAIDAEISRATYARIERDESDVTVSDLEKIAKVLKITVIDILTYNTEHSRELDKLKLLLDEKDKELREKDKEIISLQKQLLKFTLNKKNSK